MSPALLLGVCGVSLSVLIAGCGALGSNPLQILLVTAQKNPRMLVWCFLKTLGMGVEESTEHLRTHIVLPED